MLLFLFAWAIASAGTVTAGNGHGAHIHGILRDSTSGAPIAGVTVVLLDSQRVRYSTTTGEFDLGSLSPGTYRIGFRRLGYYDRAITLTVERDTSILVHMLPLGYQAQPIIVEGKRSSVVGTEHAHELDTRQLDRHRGQTLGELIEELPQVALLQTGVAIAKPVIRGLHSQRVVITSNGIAHQSQEWGLDHAPALDPFVPSSIAVVSGAASIEDSYSAIGGIIRIEPPPIEFHRPVEGKFSLVGASNNALVAASALVRGSDAVLPNTGYVLQASAHIAGDSRTPDYVLSNTGSRQISGLVSLGYDQTSWRHSVSYSIFSAELGILAASHTGTVDDLRRAIEHGTPLIIRPWTYTINNPRQQIIHQALQMQSIYSGDAGTIELRYGWQRNDRSEFDAHNTRYLDSSALRQALQRPAIELSLATYQLEARYRRSGTHSSTTFGLHLLRQSNTRSGNVYLVPDYLLYEGGLIGVHTLSLGQWIVSVGARSDVQWMRARPYNRSIGAAEPDSTLLFVGLAIHCGVERLLADRWRLQVNLASHWRPPSAVELYANDLHHGTAQFEIGNRLLGVERVYSLDARTVKTFDRMTLDISAYAMYFPRFTQLLPDSIPTVTFRGTFPTMRYMQRTAALIGGEVAWSIPLSRTFRFDGQMAIVRGFDPTTDEWLPFLPADRGRITLHYHADRIGSLKAAYAELSLDAVRRQTLIAATTFDYAAPPAGYATLTLTVGGKIDLNQTPVELNLSVHNLLNQPYRDYLSRYRYFALNPGRNYTLHLTVPFGMFHSQSHAQ